VDVLEICYPENKITTTQNCGQLLSLFKNERHCLFYFRLNILYIVPDKSFCTIEKKKKMELQLFTNYIQIFQEIFQENI